jgi:Mitochondrial ATPase inhibitor, IATP
LNHRDAFNKREKANEDYTIRMREKEKLLELRKKLAEQQDHLKKLEEHMYVSPKNPKSRPTYPSPVYLQTMTDPFHSSCELYPALISIDR